MTSPIVSAFLAELDEDALSDLAVRLAPYMPTSGVDPDEPLCVPEAAQYLKCKPKRVYDLVEQHRLHVERDGTRLIFRRRHLDAYLSGSRDAGRTA